MNKVILIRYGELYLKGKNKSFFEKLLIKNIKNALINEKYVFERISGRYFIKDYDLLRENEIINALQKVFGITSLSVADEMDTDENTVFDYFKTIKLNANSFRVSVNRADKSFKYNSLQLSKLLGEIIYENNNIAVDLYNPEIEIFVDVRQNKKTYVFAKSYAGARGLPVASSGKGLVMLSGGIDSPVATYKMASRGMKLSGLHFHSYPYTSLEAKEKVVSLAKQIKAYTDMSKLYVINFTKIQEAIHKFCEPSYMITIMRRIMLEIAEKMCKRNKFKAIITGESLGQVASQTVESITVTNNAVQTIPVFRPLIGMDKEEIIYIAQKIGTFDISILPYEDCCTVFLPKYPVIKPNIEMAQQEQSKIENLNQLIYDAIINAEIIEI